MKKQALAFILGTSIVVTAASASTITFDFSNVNFHVDDNLGPDFELDIRTLNPSQRVAFSKEYPNWYLIGYVQDSVDGMYRKGMLDEIHLSTIVQKATYIYTDKEKWDGDRTITLFLTSSADPNKEIPVQGQGCDNLQLKASSSSSYNIIFSGTLHEPGMGGDPFFENLSCQVKEVKN